MAEQSLGDDTGDPLSIFELPSLGSDMDFGSVVEWFVAPGDQLKRGDVVARVSTEKSDIDIEIWHAGTVVDLIVDLDDEVPVGAPLLSYHPSVPASSKPVRNDPVRGTSARKLPLPTSEPSAPVRVAGSAAELVETVQPASVRASPLARSLALERNLDLSEVAGSGPNGAVLVRDLHSGPGMGTQTPPRDSKAGDRATTMRRAIAERMARANRDIPHYHLETDIDMARSLVWLADYNESHPITERILPAALFVRATALAAAQHPDCNGFWLDEAFEPADSVDVAVAVSLRQGGLVTPVIAGADRLSLGETMLALKERAMAARSGSLRSSWMIDASITVSNLGDLGALRMHGVIFPPQVALVGIGRIHSQAWAIDDTVLPRPVVTVSFAGDHRATDGAVGSLFLSTLANYLEHPEKL